MTKYYSKIDETTIDLFDCSAYLVHFQSIKQSAVNPVGDDAVVFEENFVEIRVIQIHVPVSTEMQHLHVRFVEQFLNIRKISGLDQRH